MKEQLKCKKDEQQYNISMENTGPEKTTVLY
jgi:hypothetical protein